MPLNLIGIVCGVGGCGKSFLIEVLSLYVRSKYSVDVPEESVQLTAPTGLAAFNIKGLTLHKKLRVPVQHGTDQTFYDLSRDEQKRLSVELRNTKLFIIDEFSMVSNYWLTCIHKRLCQASGQDVEFGGFNILFFGDPLQLQPVRADFCFQTLKATDIERYFGAVGGAPPLLERLQYFELLENMRQKDDEKFAGLLARVRLGLPTVGDLETLESRLLSNCLTSDLYLASSTSTVTAGSSSESQAYPIGTDTTNSSREYQAYPIGTVTADYSSEYQAHPIGSVTTHSNSDPTGIIMECPTGCQLFSKLLAKDSRAVCLLPKNNMVDSFNESMLKQEQIKTVRILAVDFNTGRKMASKKRGRKKSQLKGKTLKTSDTGGLEEELIIGVGARVMLRRNLSVADGLVNGAVGFVTRISEPVTDPPSIFVKFEGHFDATEITRIAVDFEVSRGIIMTRSQFPLCLGYALTIHKSQGLTLKSILVDLGWDVFEHGMAYVALSRVKTLEGVYLLQLDPTRYQGSAGRTTPEIVQMRRQHILLVKQYISHCLYHQHRHKAVLMARGHKSTTNPSQEALTEEIINYYLQQLLQCKTVAAAQYVKWRLSAGITQALGPINDLPVHCKKPKAGAQSASVQTATKAIQQTQTALTSYSVSHTAGGQIKWVPLQNRDGYSCSCNCVIQLLLQVESFHRQVQNSINAGVMSEEQVKTAGILLKVLNCELNTTVPLRMAMYVCSPRSDINHLSMQEDAHAVFSHLMQTFPSQLPIHSIFTYLVDSVLKCRTCGTSKEPHRAVNHLLTMVCKREESFQQLLARNLERSESELGRVDARCNYCQVDRIHSEILTYHCGPQQKYLLLLLPKFGPDRQLIKNRRITGFLSSQIHIKQFKRKFCAVAGIIYSGSNLNHGHYMCWVRCELGWALVNDTCISKVTKNFVSLLHDVVLLCLKVMP